MIHKKNNIFVVLVAISLLLGAVSTVQAAPAMASPVGFVDYLYLINHHPDTPKANEELKAEREQAQQQFSEKAATLNDEEKQALDKQLGQQVEQKRLALLGAVTEKINAAVKEVAIEKGLSVVVGKNVIIYGGVDITDDVLKKIGGK